MKYFISNYNRHKPEGLQIAYESKNIFICNDRNINKYKLNDTTFALVSGNILGARKGFSFDIYKPNKRKIIEILNTGNVKFIKNSFEGSYAIILVNFGNKEVKIFSDKFGQTDIYYFNESGKYEFASDLSLFSVKPSVNGYSQIGIAHALNVYGFRPAKLDSLYNSFKRLGQKESANIKDSGVSFISEQHDPIKIKTMNEDDLSTYADIFINSVDLRSNAKNNIVYLSSGWDSTSILAALVHLQGPDNINCVIGEMKYSERAGVINPYEITRAKAVADFYKVNLEIIPFDLTKEVPPSLLEVSPELKKHFISSGTAITHGILAEYVKKIGATDASVFAGEISDGIHNFGFSQFATIFHPVQDFREYADKMMNYIYGPTFLRSFLDGSYKNDLVYKLLHNHYSENSFEKQVNSNDEDKKLQLLSSFFLRNLRFPLSSIHNNNLLTDAGSKMYLEEMQGTYLLNAAKNLTEDNYYYWFIDLYNSFHWQGGTVATLPKTAEAYGFEISLPFHDVRLHEFLSAMPENFGRGLDLNPTKYPLKWTLKNRIKYPNHLQIGPHSYLYDTDHSFNHAEETWNHSKLKGYFQSILSEKKYLEMLSDEYFNIKYLDSCVDKYLNQKELSIKEISDIMPLTYLLMVGVY